MMELERRGRLEMVGLPTTTKCPQCGGPKWWHCNCAQFPRTNCELEAALRAIGAAGATRLTVTQTPKGGDWVSAWRKEYRTSGAPPGWAPRTVAAVIWAAGTRAECVFGEAPWIGEGKEPSGICVDAVIAALPDLGLPWPQMRTLEVERRDGLFILRATVTEPAAVTFSLPPVLPSVDWSTLRSFDSVRAWRRALFSQAAVELWGELS